MPVKLSLDGLFDRPPVPRIQRIGVVISPDLDPSLGSNVNGPSLIRVPDWVESRLGRYYLYFAHHKGRHIRLAVADSITGRWRIHAPGTLRIEQTPCVEHIASPDVHVDEAQQRIIMYFHGPIGAPSSQFTFAASSTDGIHFEVHEPALGGSYFRVFFCQGSYYAFSRGGLLLCAEHRFGPFRPMHNPFVGGSQESRLRHLAVLTRSNLAYILYSRIGDRPESILLSTMRLEADPAEWKASSPVRILRPERQFEGADLPLESSTEGMARTRLRQVRDPAIYEEEDETHLLYSVAGESGIALARIWL